MTTVHRLAAPALLAVGVAVVFLGLTSAQGFTPGAMAVSAVAVAALLYTGGVWFGRPPAPPSIAAGTHGPLLFDAEIRLLGGPAAGQPIAEQFPDHLRALVEHHCAAALAGSPSRFPCTLGDSPVVYDAVPIRGADGDILFGVLLRDDRAGARSGAAAVTV